MTLDEIRELIQLVTDTGVAELEVQRGEDRVRIRRGFTRRVHDVGFTPEAGADHRQTEAAAGVAPRHEVKQAPTEQDVDANLVIVKSPIVGTFYESPSPGAPAFVRVGDKVQPGQVLCIIESMKLMNEIESEVAGAIVSKLIANGQPVEYGEALFTIRPS